jgi:hypothetical protein
VIQLGTIEVVGFSLSTVRLDMCKICVVGWLFLRPIRVEKGNYCLWQIKAKDKIPTDNDPAKPSL